MVRSILQTSLSGKAADYGKPTLPSKSLTRERLLLSDLQRCTRPVDITSELLNEGSEIETARGGTTTLVARLQTLQTYSPQLRTTAARALFAEARYVAEDMVADVIGDVWNGQFHQLPESELGLLGFVKGVLRNRAMHVNRDCRRVQSLNETHATRNIIDQWDKANQIIVVRDVRKALMRLSARQRQIATLHWLHQHTCPHIAADLGISVRTVKELLRRARKVLRAELNRYEPSSVTSAMQASAASTTSRETSMESMSVVPLCGVKEH